VWVAKCLHPRLLRERDAYTGPLAGAGLAPELSATLTDDQGRVWLILEDGGIPLTLESMREHASGCVELLARIHQHSWRPGRRGFRLRPVHVEHGRRHLKGEWSIALSRVRRATEAGTMAAEDLPGAAEATRILGEAWNALSRYPARFIHGDLQPANLLVLNTGTIQAIDWSQWGMGSPLWDLAGLTLDLAERDRAAFLEAYLAARRVRDFGDWAEALDRVRPLRHILGLGVLADHTLNGDPAGFVARGLERRLEGWRRSRVRTLA
jgi:Ser/Thr protein kinase RdoA (MazF antagonist)